MVHFGQPLTTALNVIYQIGGHAIRAGSFSDGSSPPLLYACTLDSDRNHIICSNQTPTPNQKNGQTFRPIMKLTETNRNQQIQVVASFSSKDSTWTQIECTDANVYNQSKALQNMFLPKLDTGGLQISWFHNSWSPLFRDSVTGLNFVNSSPFHYFEKIKNQKLIFIFF